MALPRTPDDAPPSPPAWRWVPVVLGLLVLALIYLALGQAPSDEERLCEAVRTMAGGTC